MKYVVYRIEFTHDGGRDGGERREWGDSRVGDGQWLMWKRLCTQEEDYVFLGGVEYGTYCVLKEFRGCCSLVNEII